jgi:hypothetical protein
MEDLLIAILQAVFEFVVEVLSYMPFEWSFPERLPESQIGRCLMWFTVGCLLAAFSMFFFEQTWIRFSVLRIANLILAPLTSGILSLTIARYRSREDDSIIPHRHFWQAFCFTLGIVLVRFAYASRS